MKRDEILKKLAELRVFKGLDPREIENVVKDLRICIESYRKGGVIMQRGERYSSMMILLEGILSAEFLNEEGKVVEVDRMEAPEEIAPGIIFASEPVLPVDLVAVEDVLILRIDRDELLTLLMRDRRLMTNFLCIVSDKLKKVADRFYEVSMRELEDKIMNYLVDLSTKIGSNEFELPHTKEELARRFGVTRPSVSRAFSSLVQRGVIEHDGKTVRILQNPAGVIKV